MTRPSLLRGAGCALATACFAASGAVAQLPGGFTRANLAGAPVEQVAERILGRDLAVDVESFSLDPNFPFPGGALMSARFFHRPQPKTAEICGREEDVVGFEPIAGLSDATLSRDSPSRIDHFARLHEISLAPGCRLAPGQSFAYVGEHIGVEAAMRALTALGEARRAAANPGPLPFRYTCRDDLHRDHCRGDGRAALATLPLERTFEIETDGADAVQFSIPGETVYWSVRLTGLGTHHAELELVAQAPPSF